MSGGLGGTWAAFPVLALKMWEQRWDRGRVEGAQGHLATEPGWARLGRVLGGLQGNAACVGLWAQTGPAPLPAGLGPRCSDDDSSGRPPGAVGVEAFQTFQQCEGLPWSLSVTAGPSPRSPRRRALTPGHMLNPPGAPDGPLSPAAWGGAGWDCQERGPRKSFLLPPSCCPVPQTRLGRAP